MWKTFPPVLALPPNQSSPRALRTVCARHRPARAPPEFSPSPPTANTASSQVDRAFPAAPPPHSFPPALAIARKSSCAAPTVPFARARSGASHIACWRSLSAHYTNQTHRPAQTPCATDSGYAQTPASATPLLRQFPCVRQLPAANLPRCLHSRRFQKPPALLRPLEQTPAPRQQPFSPLPIR